MGTFRGYGAYVGINPYRECVSDASSVELGETALKLLSLAGPTGRDWADRESYLADTADLSTQEVKSKYRLDRPWMSTSKSGGTLR